MLYRVNFNMAGFAFDEYFDNRQDAEYFAKDRQAVGFQTLIVKVK
jgi:hypothetical protein